MSAVDHVLHLIAWTAIQVWPPDRAKRRVDAIGSLLAPLDLDEARRLAGSLRGGTCLSRSLVVSARLAGSEVIIGSKARRLSEFQAHAWVELRGQCIGTPEQDVEFVRLRRAD